MIHKHIKWKESAFPMFMKTLFELYQRNTSHLAPYCFMNTLINSMNQIFLLFIISNWWKNRFTSQTFFWSQPGPVHCLWNNSQCKISKYINRGWCHIKYSIYFIYSQWITGIFSDNCSCFVECTNFLLVLSKPSCSIIMWMRYSGIKRGVTPTQFHYISPEKPPDISNIQETLSAFDIIQPVVGYSTLFTQKLTLISDIGKWIRGYHYQKCINYLFTQYDNDFPENFSTMPLPIEHVPYGHKVLVSVIPPNIKPDGKYMDKFQTSQYSNVITNIRGSNLNSSFVPVIRTCLVNYMTPRVNSWNSIGGFLDMTNDFSRQNPWFHW